MDKLKLLCKNCDYQIEIFESEIADNTECPLCEHELILDEEKSEIKDENLRIIIDKMLIDRMKKEINSLGNQRAYEIIERMRISATRVRYRKYFLLAGGEVPQNMTITENSLDEWYLN